MGLLKYVACHECKEKAYLDKWDLVNACDYQIFINDIEQLISWSVEKAHNQNFLFTIPYNLGHLRAFVEFFSKHNGHKVEYLTEHHKNYDRIRKKYKESKNSFKSKDSDKILVPIWGYIKVAEILNELIDNGVIKDWVLSINPESQGTAFPEGIIFLWSMERFVNGVAKNKFEVRMPLKEIERSKNDLKKVIIGKIENVKLKKYTK